MTVPKSASGSTPDEDDGAFAALIGRYAAHLDGGRAAADAWRDAISATGWEEAHSGAEAATDEPDAHTDLAAL